MKRAIAHVFALLLLLPLSGIALAQTAADAPKPGPEHRHLGYFVGTWRLQGEMKPNPFVPAGKFTTTDSCEWFEGGFVVVCHSEGQGAAGRMKGINLIGYSTEDKKYTFYAVDNGPLVMTNVARGERTGDTWTFTDEATVAGQLFKSRFTVREISGASYAFKSEIQGPDGAWTTTIEGAATKTKGRR